MTNIYDKDAFWDFVTLRPESMHELLHYFSDRGIPDGYRHMHGYGVNTYKLISQENKIFYCRFVFKACLLNFNIKKLLIRFSQFVLIFKTNQGIKNLSEHKALELAGKLKFFFD